MARSFKMSQAIRFHNGFSSLRRSATSCTACLTSWMESKQGGRAIPVHWVYSLTMAATPSAWVCRAWLLPNVYSVATNGVLSQLKIWQLQVFIFRRLRNTTRVACSSVQEMAYQTAPLQSTPFSSGWACTVMNGHKHRLLYWTTRVFWSVTHAPGSSSSATWP